MTTQPVRIAAKQPGKYVAGVQEVRVDLCVAGIGQDKALILGSHYPKLAASTGEAIVALEPNDNINPDGTWYVATFPDRSEWAFIVPANLDPSTPTDMTDNLVADPALPGSIVVGVSPLNFLLALASAPDSLAAGAITRQTSAVDPSVTFVRSFVPAWPDGASGTFTGTESLTVGGAIDSYVLTHVLNGVTITYTQPTMTRGADGSVTTRPALVVT